VLEVKAHNWRAIQLYERLGFVEVGRRMRFYQCGADALLMAKQPSSAGEQEQAGKRYCSTYRGQVQTRSAENTSSSNAADVCG
jgi:hypothetical protein